MADGRRVLAPEVLVRGAALHYLRTAGLDMDALATELTVSRATLYRAAGSRDALLGRVFWAIGRRLLDEARAEAGGPGVEAVIEVSRVFAELLTSTEQLGRFVAAEPETAARVLFDPAGEVHRRAVETQLDIFRAAGLGDPGRDLAFLYARIMESVCYATLLGNGPVDFSLAEPALRALLTSPPPG